MSYMKNDEAQTSFLLAWVSTLGGGSKVDVEAAPCLWQRQYDLGVSSSQFCDVVTGILYDHSNYILFLFDFLMIYELSNVF